jgi:hypothetical protein
MFALINILKCVIECQKRVYDLLNLMINDLSGNDFDGRGCPFPPLILLLIGLRLYATGSIQQVVGDTIGASQPTVSRVVVKVSKSIAKLS